MSLSGRIIWSNFTSIIPAVKMWYSSFTNINCNQIQHKGSREKITLTFYQVATRLWFLIQLKFYHTFGHQMPAIELNQNKDLNRKSSIRAMHSDRKLQPCLANYCFPHSFIWQTANSYYMWVKLKKKHTFSVSRLCFLFAFVLAIVFSDGCCFTSVFDFETDFPEETIVWNTIKVHS